MPAGKWRPPAAPGLFIIVAATPAGVNLHGSVSTMDIRARFSDNGIIGDKFLKS
jgi:hypothetical protein